MDSKIGERFVWVDIETTGLVPSGGLLLEVGFRITDIELDLIDENDWQIWESPLYDEHCGDDFELLAPFILNMHTKSGLLEDARSTGMDVADAAKDITHWLEGHGVDKTEPMCGSSVQFDREWLREKMPVVEQVFSYRNLDISTVKELCKRLNPTMYAQLDKYSSKREVHRAIPDLQDTCSEARFYFDNFLFIGD